MDTGRVMKGKGGHRAVERRGSGADPATEAPRTNVQAPAKHQNPKTKNFQRNYDLEA